MKLPAIRFEDQAPGSLSDHSDPKYRKPPSEYDDYVWHLGWTDGRYGQPQENNEAVLRAEAKLKWQQKVAAAEAEIETARARVNQSGESVGRLRPAVEQLRQGRLDMVTERSRNPQAYSLSLWLIYSTVAILLFAADLPLSLKLVAMGYGVTTRDNNYSVDNLLTNPGYVVTNFWEAMLLALGIALSGVFVKYFIDSAVFDDENQTKSRFFRPFLYGIGALFLSTIVLLGFFRAGVQREESVKQLTQKVEALAEENQQRPDLAISRTITDLQQQIQEQRGESPLSIRTLSFILLTLLFPIVGGICFAVGWRKLIKLRQYRRLAGELEACEARYDAESARYEAERGGLAALEKRLRRELDEYGTSDAYAELQVGLYRHGYMRGRNVPETIDANASLYERCETSVAKLLAKRMRNKYWDEPATPVRQ
jgi:hypothetical protein